jgi:cytochrome c553
MLAMLGLSTVSVADTRPELVKEGGQVIKAFAKELKSTLQGAVKKGGFPSGIEACSIQAENIASKHSQGQWTISRTSLKPRNSKNVPDPWEAKVLADFERQLASGAAIKDLTATTTQKGAFRMMKAIPTQGMCLACHGKSLAKTVKQTLLEKYPHDQATGYKEGEIRGAFSLVYKEK